jgi:hypothetical protein
MRLRRHSVVQLFALKKYKVTKTFIFKRCCCCSSEQRPLFLLNKLRRCSVARPARWLGNRICVAAPLPPCRPLTSRPRPIITMDDHHHRPYHTKWGRHNSSILFYHPLSSCSLYLFSSFNLMSSLFS